jgi:hypothetical protein
MNAATGRSTSTRFGRSGVRLLTTAAHRFHLRAWRAPTTRERWRGAGECIVPGRTAAAGGTVKETSAATGHSTNAQCSPSGACSSTAAARCARRQARRAPTARERGRGSAECVVPGRAAPRAARATRGALRPVVLPARGVARRARARRRRQRAALARWLGGLLEPEVKGPARVLDGTCLERRRFAAILWMAFSCALHFCGDDMRSLLSLDGTNSAQQASL